MIVEKYISVEKELEIVGATLLSLEEAELISLKERTYNNRWWLRSPGHDTCYAAYVYYFGDIYYSGFRVGNRYACVRPALILRNLEKTNFQIGDIFEINNWKFKIISDTRAWMYNNDIGCTAFHKNWRLKSANDYEKSDVKKYVDEWFKELIK